jgi:hypothetical protein
MRQAAAEVLIPRFGALTDHEREEKSAGEVVTVADRECEKLLSLGLYRLLPEADDRWGGSRSHRTRPCRNAWPIRSAGSWTLSTAPAISLRGGGLSGS